MPSLASSVASEPPTFSEARIRCTSDTISTHPLLILVGHVQRLHVSHMMTSEQCLSLWMRRRYETVRGQHSTSLRMLCSPMESMLLSAGRPKGAPSVTSGI